MDLCKVHTIQSELITFSGHQHQHVDMEGEEDTYVYCLLLKALIKCFGMNEREKGYERDVSRAERKLFSIKKSIPSERRSVEIGKTRQQIFPINNFQF